jgi:hypothetical protein
VIAQVTRAVSKIAINAGPNNSASVMESADSNTSKKARQHPHKQALSFPDFMLAKLYHFISVEPDERVKLCCAMTF